MKASFEHEEILVNEFPEKRDYYKECVEKYRASMLRQRRQRSLQRYVCVYMSIYMHHLSAR